MRRGILGCLGAAVALAVFAGEAAAQQGLDCASCDIFTAQCISGAGTDDRCVVAASGEWCASWGNLSGICEEEETEQELLVIAPSMIGGSGTVVSSPLWLAQTSFDPSSAVSDEVLRTCRSIIVARRYADERRDAIKKTTDLIQL